VDGVPGATGLGILTGVYNIVTLPEHRGRGYGRLVTGRVMTDGFDDRLPAVVADGPSRPGPI
jgi:ribosomal protein S18 acetylase RimI-like enzyme